MKKRLLASLMAATVAVTTLTGCGKTDSSKRGLPMYIFTKRNMYINFYFKN